MNTTFANTLINQILPVSINNKPLSSTLQKAILISLGVALLTISAKTSIRFYPVPMTLQTMVVLLIGLTYGSRLGLATIVSYLALGAMGLSVFAGTPEKGIGLVYMTGTTGGFLVGFVLAVIAMGQFAVYKYDRSYLRTFLAMLVGEVIIFACGIIYLGTLIGWDKPIFEWALIPFYPAEILKIVAVTLMMPTAWKLIKK